MYISVRANEKPKENKIMKKMLMVLMMVFGLSAAFAYEPKKECVTVKGNKIRYEVTYDGFCSRKTRIWTYKIKSGKFIYLKSGTFDRMWSDLLQCRERHDIYLNAAKYKDETCSTCAFLEKYKSAYENGELNETEMKQYESMVNLHQAQNNLKGAIEGKPAHAKTGTKSYYEVCANDCKMKCINNMPFITEENWYTITEEEWNGMLKDFIEEVKAENK